MQIQKFEDIVAWQKAKSLAVDIYKGFYDLRDYSFKDQIQRASISISNNIAEGFERKGNKEFMQFLFIAKGSCAEVRSMTYLAMELGYLDNEKQDLLHNRCSEISRIISALIKSLK